MRLHHVQVLCPIEGLAAARRFYGEVLGLEEIARPDSLSSEGIWYELSDGGQLHVGVPREDDEPSRSRAHYALETDDLDALCARLKAAGMTAIEPPDIPGWRRVHVRDPSGNMLELLMICR